MFVSTRMHEMKYGHNLSSLNITNKKPKKSDFEMQVLGMLTSRNFAGSSILTLEFNPENFR